MIPAILLHVGEVRARAACGLEGLACGRKDLVDLLGRLGSLDGGLGVLDDLGIVLTGVAGQSLTLVQELCQLKRCGVLRSGESSLFGSLAGLFGGLALRLRLFGSGLSLGQIVDQLRLDLDDLLIGLGHLAGILGSLSGRGGSLDLGLLGSLERELGSGLGVLGSGLCILGSLLGSLGFLSGLLSGSLVLGAGGGGLLGLLLGLFGLGLCGFGSGLRGFSSLAGFLGSGVVLAGLGSGCLGGLIYFAFVVSISIILACVGWMAASDVLALNKEPVTATVTLDKSEFKDVTISYTDADGNAKERSGHQVSVGYVAKQLKDAGIIKYKGLFELYCSVSHAKTKIDPGTYELSTNYDYRALVKKMQVGSGAMVTTKVTVPEGYTMEQIFRKLEDENVCSYDDLMDAAANYSYNYSFIDQSMQGDAKRLEGFLFPDTYEFYQGMQASSAINKFLENFHDRITAEMLEKADERGMTMQEVVTVASMIEKEAANDDERAMIAAVIYNRIEAGMPLQIDSTIMYVLPEHKDVLTVEDTKIDSPYNTYQNKGLPPTPIANPGLASIKAALSPASTQALYYALDAESGTHKFFTNYGEFQAFVAKQSYSQ